MSLRKRRGADDIRGRGLQRQLLAHLEQPLEAAGAVGERALLLNRHLRRRKLPLQLVVFDFGAPQADIAVPQVADAGEAAGGRALDLGEDAEGHRFEDRDAFARVDLCRDEQHMTQHHRDEEIARPLTEIQDGHKNGAPERVALHVQGGPFRCA
jgi:hypothetical protein